LLRNIATQSCRHFKGSVQSGRRVAADPNVECGIIGGRRVKGRIN
jgi:hypothetical protein